MDGTRFKVPTGHSLGDFYEPRAQGRAKSSRSAGGAINTDFFLHFVPSSRESADMRETPVQPVSTGPGREGTWQAPPTPLPMKVWTNRNVC